MPLFRINGVLIYFVHIPKTGGSSVESYLSSFGSTALLTTNDHSWPHCNAQHMEAAAYKRILPREFYDYGFSIVRNPFDRIVSEYRMRRLDQASRGRGIKEFPEWVESVFRRYKRDYYILDNHIRPQGEFVSEGIEVFRLENELVKAIQRIGEVANISLGPDFPRMRASKPIRFKVSRSSAEMISDFYRDDFDRFNYINDTAYLLEKEDADVVSNSSKYTRLIKYYTSKLSRRSLPVGR